MKYTDELSLFYIAATFAILLFFVIFIIEANKNKKKLFKFTVALKALTAVFLGVIVLTGIKAILPDSCKNNEQLISLAQISCSALVAICLYKLYIEGTDEQIDDILKKIDSKYGDGNAYASLYFRHLFEKPHSFEKELVLKEMLNNHKILAENQTYLVSFDTYLNIVVSLLKNGYSLISVNSTLLPYWYVPVNFDIVATKDYINSLKEYRNCVKRITYCEEENWWNNSVKMIFDDLADGERGKKYAIEWLATLYRAVGKEPSKDKELIGLDDSNKYFNYDFRNNKNEQIENATNKQWEQIESFVATNSVELTNFIKKKYEQEMGTADYCLTKQYHILFPDKPTEIGLFKKGNDVPITIFLLGNVSQVVKIKIITDKEENSKYEKDINNLFNKKCYLLKLFKRGKNE